MTAKQNLKVVEPEPVDPFRVEIGLAIADRSMRQEEVATAKGAIERLKSLLEKTESKRSLALTGADEERAERISYLETTARSRTPETQPLSPARRALGEAAEEVSAAQAALSLAQEKRTRADAELAAASAKVGRAISALLCRDLAKRIAAAERLHDQFMAAQRCIDEIVKDADVPEDLAARLRMLRVEQQSLLHFDHELAFGAVRHWEAARKALRDDCNAAIPD